MAVEGGQRPIREDMDYDQRALERQRMMEELGLVGRSEPMLQIMETILQIAPTDVSVLITGESGTGKEVVARAIHQLSERKFKPFIAVNCGALAEGVLESELFGHEKGAFTGALSRRKGVFELADGGTILLDEIGEMPLSTQVKLLRVLEEKEFMRVGGMETIRVNVRVIAATNRDLGGLVEKGEFRRDLYYRLKVVEIIIPPLREHREDIPLLIYRFIDQFCQEYGVDFPGLTEQTMEVLVNYDWPGNVRELRNIIESMVVLSPKQKIDASDIPTYLTGGVQMDRNLPVWVDKSPDQVERELIYRAVLTLREDIAELKDIILRNAPDNRLVPLSAGDGASSGEDEKGVRFEVGTPMVEVEREMIRRTLEAVGGNRRRAARLLGISERTLYRKILSYGLN